MPSRFEGKRVRLFTRNGHDWTDRYPLIAEAALKKNQQRGSQGSC
jgi:bifunctional non-homologous end joining protein LigD